MSRIAYTAADLAEPKALIDAIKARRGGRLIHLDRLLLHSPVLAQGWNAFMGTVRRNLNLDPYLGELAICVIAVLNRAPYEFRHHAPEWKAAGGRDDQLAALARVGEADFDRSLFDGQCLCVIDLTIEMTRQIEVADETFARARQCVAGDGQMVELVTTIAAYNMVSRFLAAMQIDPD